MKQVTPKIMSGFMELLPDDQILFNKMVDTIRKIIQTEVDKNDNKAN